MKVVGSGHWGSLYNCKEQHRYVEKRKQRLSISFACAKGQWLLQRKILHIFLPDACYAMESHVAEGKTQSLKYYYQACKEEDSGDITLSIRRTRMRSVPSGCLPFHSFVFKVNCIEFKDSLCLWNYIMYEGIWLCIYIFLTSYFFKLYFYAFYGIFYKI